MRAAVIYAHNPFAPQDRRERLLRRPAHIRALAPRGNAPVIALLNGTPVMRAAWRRTVRNGDRLVFVTLPRGGGGNGGNGGSNPMQVILTIALFAFAGPIAGAILPGASGLVLAGAKLGIQLIGSALINAVFPAPKSGTGPTPSPTYSLQAQGNSARLEQPIPVQYGRVMSYPDFAAQPYWEYAGQDQYVFHLLCIGAGEFDIEEIRIEDTPISAFEEITTEIVQPFGSVTLFPAAVITSTEVSGQEMIGRQTGTWTRSGTVITVTLTAHGFASGQVKWLYFATGGAVEDAYAITGVTTNTFTVTAPAVGTSGALSIYAVVGGIDGFVASAAATVANKIGIDFILPIGLYHRDSGGSLTTITAGYNVQVRQVDDLGAPIGSWITLENGAISGRSVTPQRVSYSYPLTTPGRYRVRVFRSNDRASTTDNGDQLLWGGLRAYLTETTNFGPVTLLAMKMRATNNLSLQSSRKVGVIATRKVPIWNSTTFSAATASTSIAWAIADAARNTTYGPGLANAQIDLAALLALDAVWTARGDRFNARFDSAGSWWDAVQKIAAAGRAQCFMQGGILRVVRDKPQTVPVAMFSMRNIKAGSFSTTYLMGTDATADAVTATYWDASTWAPQRVTGKVPGSSALKPAKMDLFGIDNRDHALREATYHAAANRFRRRIVKFATEMEGFIPAYGDLIGIQHDMPGWGLHAEAVGWNAETQTLSLSEPVTVTGASVVSLRRNNGSLSGPWAVTAGATEYDVILTLAPDITPEVLGQTRERTHVTFGTTSTYVTMALVVSVQPRGIHEVEIEAVTEDPSVHTAEDGIVAPPIRTSMLPRRARMPVVSGLFARKIPNDAISAAFGWRPAPGADIYNVEMAEGTNVLDPTTGWTRVADTEATQTTRVLMFANRTMIRVRASGLIAGPWIAATVGALIPDMYNTDATAFYTADANPMWSA